MNGWGVLVLVACVMGAAACDDDNGTPAPSNQPLVFTAQMSAAQEVPPVTNAEPGATGNATITITPTRFGERDHRRNCRVRVHRARTDATEQHHPRAYPRRRSGVAGGVLANTGLSAATAIPTPAGSAGVQSPSPVSVDAATINSIVANPAGFYFNVHTSLNPGGVVRGQLRAQ